MPTDNVPTPPERDSRPRPRYGELAPEGWNWTPAAEQQAPVPPAPLAQDKAAGLPDRGVDGVPSWDRPLTLGLLILGLLATFLAVGMLNLLTEAMQMLYTQEDLGTYTQAASVAGLVTVGSITEALVWLVSATVAITLVVRGKRAFYVPLIGAVVAFVLIFVFMSVVLATDPTLIDFYSRP